MRAGRFSRRDIERELDRKSTGRKPGKKATQPRFRDLGPREKELARPFIERYGLRNFRRLLWSLPFAANELDWSAQKKQRYAQCLRDGADAIFPAAPNAGEPPAHGELLEKRASERKRLTDASRTRITRNSGTIVHDQVGADAPEVEFIPFFPNGINPEDEGYLFGASDPAEFLRRANERGVRFLEKSDPAVRRPHALEQNYTPDLAGEIDRKNEPKQRDVTEDILADYQAITDSTERWRFLLHNKEAIHAARTSVAKRNNFEHMQNIAARQKWRWIKTDDRFAWKGVPPKTTARSSRN
jgi:hypothetical protein